MTKPIADRNIERALVGCLMIDARNLLDEVRDHVSEEDFTDPNCAAVFRAIVEIDAAREAVDTLTVSARAKAVPFDWLLEVTQTIPTLGSAMTYARRVEALSKRRAMADAGRAIIADAADTDGDTEACLSAAESAVLAVADRRAARKAKSIMEVAGDLLARIGDRAPAEPRMPSGLSFVDGIMRGGARPGRVVVVAGRPGMGKTAFALKWAMSTAKAGSPVLFHTLEMPAEELGERAAAAEAGVNLGSIGANELNPREAVEIVEATGRFAEYPIVIDDTAGVTLGAIRARARRVKRSYGGRLGLVVIDYLQLMGRPSTGNKNEREDQQLGAITRGLKVMAKEMNVAVLLLCQLNRKVDERGDRKPQMSDLRGSGEIEQDADAILFLSKATQDGEEVEGVADVTVEKQRGGATGCGRVSWERQFTRFASLAQDGGYYS